MNVLRVTFWADAIERAISTAATAALGVLTAGTFALIGDVPWYGVISTASLAALIDLLRSLSAAPRGNPGTAAFSKAIEAADLTGESTVLARFVGGDKGGRR